MSARILRSTNKIIRVKHTVLNGNYCYNHGVNGLCIRSISSWSDRVDKFKLRTMELLPGACCSGAIMTGGYEIAEHVGQMILNWQGVVGASPVSGIPIAILLGMSVNGFLPNNVRQVISPGLKYCTTTVLRAGIVCVGIKLSALEIVSLGSIGIPIVVTSIGTTLMVTKALGKYLGLSDNLTSLVAAGSSICGVTAITAVAPVVKANQQEISLAVANVVAFGTMGMLIYPYLLPTLLTSSQQIGTVMGLAIHDTSQVMGAALTYQSIHADDLVLKAAAVTKLTRNLFLAGVIPYFAMQAKKAASLTSIGPPTSNTIAAGNNVQKRLFTKVTEVVPLFVLGFVGMSAVRTAGDAMLASELLALGVFDASSWKVSHAFVGNELGGHYLLGTAMAAVGLGTNLASLRGVGVKPFVLGFAGAACTATTAYTLVHFLGNAGLMP